MDNEIRVFQFGAFRASVINSGNCSFQMKGTLAVQDMMSSLDARKLELAVGLKQREALLHKLKLG